MLVLAAPVLTLSAFVLQAVHTDLAERSASQRLRTVDLSARLIEGRLTAAGAELVSVTGRASLREALRSRDAAGIAPHLRDLKASSVGYTTAVALDPRGIFLVGDPNDPAVVGRDLSARDYFVGGMAARGPFTSEAFATAGGPVPVAVAVSLAVRDERGVLGMVLVGLSPQLVLASLDPIASIDGREILILDKAGRVVSSTNADRRPLAPADLPGLDLARLGPQGSTLLTAGKGERVVTYARVPSVAWTLLVIDNPTVVFAVEHRLESDITKGAAVAVGAALLAGVVLAVLSGSLARQRRKLASANATLAEANARLDEATRAKSEFLANMSHELRTPLNAILGFSQLLEERLGASLEERQRSWLRNIQTAGTHLLDLINDVLDLSKVEAGRYEVRPEQTTVADLLAPVLATVRQDAEARGLTFEVSGVPATTVLVDPLRTRQILHNLLSNAAKFTERGGQVRLATGVTDRDLRFVVSDTGIGIPAADQGRVFGVFERFHEGQHQATGTGLGLALTKRIVELQGGSISFTSEAGVGTTFVVSFPGVVRDAMTGPRILVVEDDSRDAALIAAVVAEIGLPVEFAVTGATALATVRRDLPTAIVLDLRLPDMRGEDVLQALQADGAARRLPVIVVTVEDDEGRTRPLGADDHLTKPIETARLRRWLRLVADGQRERG